MSTEDKEDVRPTYHKKWRERKKLDPVWVQKERERCRAKTKARREKDRDKHNKDLRDWRKNNVASVLVSQTRTRARRIGVECDIDVDFVKSLLSTVRCCPYVKVPFDTAKPNGLRMNPWAPSLDRVDSGGGYVRSNIELVSNWWNLAKHEWPADVVNKALAGLRS